MKGTKNEHSSGEEALYFGFLPQHSISDMQSPNYDQRIESSQEILEYVPTIPIEEIEVSNFLRFVQNYIADANLKVAQNCSLIVEEVITALKDSDSIPVHLIVSIAFDQLTDSRRFVIQLGCAVIGDLLRATDPKEVVEEMIKSSATAPANLLTQIFRCFTTLITQNVLKPSLLVDYAFYFDTALTSPVDNIKQAALWCVDFLKANYSDTYDELIKQLSSSAAKTVGRVVQNPATAIPKNRVVGPQVIRPINTAGIVEVAKTNMALSQNGYRRPALPSAGARRLFSLSRPVSSTFVNSLDTEAKTLEKFNFEPVEFPTPNYNEKFTAPPEPEHDDEVLFGDLPDPNTLSYNDGGFQNSGFTPNIKILDNVFETDIELDETKPKVGPAHFENAVFEEIPKAKMAAPKQPRTLRSKLHKEYDELPTGNFGGSHFDEKAFNDIQPLVKPKSRNASAFGDHAISQVSNDVDSPKKIVKARALPPINEHQKQDSSKSSSREIETKKNRTASAFGALNPESLEIVPTKPKTHSVRFEGFPEPSKPKIFDPEARPISTSGEYNFGDDLGDEDLPSLPPKVTIKVKPRPKKLTVKPKTIPPPETPVKERKAPSTPSPQQFIDNLQSDDWETQNAAIENLLKGAPKEMIKSSLRNSISSLLECSQSTRTTLAKNALNLILMWIEDKDIPVTGVADVMGARLLKLLQQQSSHHFIAELGGKCFLALLENVPDNRICTIINRESKSPYAPARSMVANGAFLSIKRIEDPTPLLLPLAFLGKDADQNTRKYAKMAVKEIAIRKKDFVEYIKANITSQEDQTTLIRLSTAP